MGLVYDLLRDRISTNLEQTWFLIVRRTCPECTRVAGVNLDNLTTETVSNNVFDVSKKYVFDNRLVKKKGETERFFLSKI